MAAVVIMAYDRMTGSGLIPDPAEHCSAWYPDLEDDTDGYTSPDTKSIDLWKRACICPFS